MDNKITIHTRVTKQEYNKLVEYGGGYLNNGISILLDIASQKSIELTIITKLDINQESS
jgi:uncharacterized membrane protein